MNEQQILKATLKKHGYGKKVVDNENLDHFSAKEKCDAILNFNRNSEVGLDTTFVESVNNRISARGNATFKQEEALNNIINGYNINMDMHL